MKNSLDKGSFWLIVVAIALFLLSTVYDTLYLHWTFYSSAFFLYFGWVFLLVGIALRLIATQTLGKQFSVFVKIQQKHHLVTKGLYRYVRHPIYSASLLALLCFVFIMNSLFGLFMFFIIVLPIILYRISLEETALLKTFGKEYLNYKKEVGGLVPKS